MKDEPFNSFLSSPACWLSYLLTHKHRKAPSVSEVPSLTWLVTVCMKLRRAWRKNMSPALDQMLALFCTGVHYANMHIAAASLFLCVPMFFHPLTDFDDWQHFCRVCVQYHIRKKQINKGRQQQAWQKLTIKHVKHQSISALHVLMGNYLECTYMETLGLYWY